MRTFVAIELSDEVRDALALAQAHLRYAGADVKWVERQNMHLTLKFLGNVPEARIPELTAALDRTCGALPAFAISLDDIEAFPSVDFPKVVWAGIRQGRNETIDLAARIDDAVSAFGFAKESRPFAAHLTIGRVRSGVNKDALKEKMSTAQLKPVHQTVDTVTLFKSTLTPAGPVYAKLHEARLRT